MGDAFPPLMLIVGNDRAMARAELARVQGAFHPDTVEVVAASKGNAAAAIDSCSMLGLFGGEKLVVATGIEAWDKDDVDAIVAYAAEPSPDAVLVLTATKVDTRSRLRKACGRRGIIECKGPEKEADVVRWVVEAFAAHGAKVSRPVAARLVQMAGHDSLDRLQSDVDRIVTWCCGEPVTVDVVTTLATSHTEEKVWALTDAWASRDKRTLLALAETLLDQGEHPVRLVGVLGRHLRLVHDARRMLATHPPGQVMHLLEQGGTNKWAARKVVEQAQRIGVAQALAALTRVALLEAELKGGAALSSGRAGGRPSSTIVFERGLCELL